MHRPAKRGIGSAQRRLVGTRRQEVFFLFTSSTFVCRYLTLTRQNACNSVGNKYLWSFMESRSNSTENRVTYIVGGIRQTRNLTLLVCQGVSGSPMNVFSPLHVQLMKEVLNLIHKGYDIDTPSVDG